MTPNICRNAEVFIIARQHAMDAECDIVVFLSVHCLSVQCRSCVKMNGHIVKLSGVGIILVFSSPTTATKFQGEPQ